MVHQELESRAAAICSHMSQLRFASENTLGGAKSRFSITLALDRCLVYRPFHIKDYSGSRCGDCIGLVAMWFAGIGIAMESI